MQTITDFFTAEDALTEQAFLTLSHTLSKHGSLQQIQQAVTSELFTLHIALHTFGNWVEGGWWTIVSEHAELLPHIPAMLEALQMKSLQSAFYDVFDTFPIDTVFSSDNDAYVARINFYENPRFKLQDATLNAIPKEERIRLSKQMHERIDALDAATEVQLYAQHEDMWNAVRTYIKHYI